MRVLRAIGLGCILAAPAFGQATYSPAVTQADVSAAVQAALPNLSNYPTKADVTAAVAAAQPNLSPYATTASVTGAITGEVTARNAAIAAAQPNLAPYATTTSVASAITAATPAPCSAPLADTLLGSAGTGSPCMARPDATRPTQVQPVQSVTAADGSWSINWPVAFGSAPSTVFASILAADNPYICQVGTKTASSATGKCFQVAGTTLPTTTTALLGLVVSPIRVPAAGLPVMIVGRQ